MPSKIKVLPIEAACDECPFYVTTVRGKHVCAFKQLITAPAAIGSVDDAEHYDEDMWDVDCNGKYDQCSFLPLFYFMDGENDDQEDQPHKLVSPDDSLEDFDPFDEDAEESEEAGEDSLDVVEPEPEPEPKRPVKDPKATQSDKPRVLVRKVANTYQVKADALGYPSDMYLRLDDQINIMSNGFIQRQCDNIEQSRQIRMGSVYATDNGSVRGYPSRVVPGIIYHAVVAGQSKLTNEGDIRKSTSNVLALAEKNGVETLAIMPFDCGTYDISATAVAQLSTIKVFLEVNEIKSLKNIVIVMEDEESYGTFLHYYARIFKS